LTEPDQFPGGAGTAPPTGGVCDRCHGTGFVHIEEDGVERAARCLCRRRRPDGDRLSALSIPPRFQHCAFEDVTDNTTPSNEYRGFHELNDSLVRAKGKARKFVDEYPIDKKGFLFMGRCGVGKTHLAVAILRDLALSKGVAGRFCDFHELLRQIKNSYNPVSGTTEMDLLQPVCHVELLVLDDLGAEKPSPWVLDTLHFVINQRYLQQLTTLITTNFLDPSHLNTTLDRRPGSFAAQATFAEETLAERIGYRLRSRLYEMCHVVAMDGSDYREGSAGI